MQNGRPKLRGLQTEKGKIGEKKLNEFDRGTTITNRAGLLRSSKFTSKSIRNKIKNSDMKICNITTIGVFIK